MNLEENSCRNHESLKQKRQESWISRFKWSRFYPRFSPLNTVLYSLRYHHFALEMIQFIHPVLPETSVPFFDSTMSMLPRINSVCKSAFYYLRNISRIRNSYPWRPRDSCPCFCISSLATATLFCIMCRSMLCKSSNCNRYRMLPPT